MTVRELITDEDRQKRIMRRFKIDELSAVDKPAQALAIAVICKRADGTQRQIDLRKKVFGDLEGKSISHPDRIDRLLKLDGVRALTFNEMRFIESLSGDARRAFILGDAEYRKWRMEGWVPPDAKDDEDKGKDQEMKLASKSFEAAGFDTFEAAVAHILKQDGGLRTAAMQKARREYPALFEKLRKDGEGVSVAKARQQERAELSSLVSKRVSVQQRVRKHARENGISELQAMRELRRSPQSPWQ